MEENTNTLRKKAEEVYKQNKFKEIIALLTDEVLEKETDAELYAWRARANHRLGCDAAVTMLFAEKAIGADPNYFMGYFARACAWDGKKEDDKSIADYNKAIDLNPDSADSYYYRGLFWQNKKENDKAIADFDKAIVNYNKAIKINPNYAEIYVWRGNTWYFKEDYDKAIADYTKAIERKQDFADAYYNRGLAYVAIKEYDKAIADYSIIIKLDSDYKDVYYNDRGLALKGRKKYKEAIEDYTKAIEIKPNFENAYYNRGLAKKEENIDLKGSKRDFEKYLELAIDENENSTKYAKYYIKELDIMIKDPELRSIIQSVKDIKGKLLIEEECVHYTRFTILKKLILEESKFRISEGNFLNDPSEGEEFFNFLKYKPHISCKNVSSAETFSPKPFIGSFVTKDKHNDLNMWRFYGKEEGVEAKGCAITLFTQEFIDDIKNSLSNEKNKKARLDDESDISFYRVVYVVHGASTSFYIPNSVNKSKELKKLMTELKTKVDSYKVTDKTFIEKYLNNIAFLFKSDAYKNENEVRLVVKGIEFEKKYNMDVTPPLVYIELESIKKRVKQITLGPKVDNVNEWASAFHYRYEEDAPTIMISHLPYK
ncbi:MAG: tetratricopeptide repeat protein [Bacteroidetes bacterium]|nr:tetratricopeptide repeat protein [Bacteroidota bacterium]